MPIFFISPFFPNTIIRCHYLICHCRSFTNKPPLNGIENERLLHVAALSMFLIKWPKITKNVSYFGVHHAETFDNRTNTIKFSCDVVSLQCHYETLSFYSFVLCQPLFQKIQILKQNCCVSIQFYLVDSSIFKKRILS